MRLVFFAELLGKARLGGGPGAVVPISIPEEDDEDDDDEEEEEGSSS